MCSVVVRRCQTGAVPSADTVILLQEVLLNLLHVGQEGHVAHVGSGIGSTLTVFTSESKYNLRTVHVVDAVDVAVVVCYRVSTVGTVHNLLAQSFALSIVVLTDEYFRVEQKASLQYTVHALVHAVNGFAASVFLGQGCQTLVKLR